MTDSQDDQAPCFQKLCVEYVNPYRIVPDNGALAVMSTWDEGGISGVFHEFPSFFDAG